jgi:hypothetical protein
MNSERSQADGNGHETPASNGISLLKKLVLLVDVNAHTRESRAKAMRTLGMEVQCTSSAHDARAKLESGAYNLILVDLGADTDGAEALVQEIRVKDPRQLVAFLVGSPLFVATSLRGKAVRPSRLLRPAAPSRASVTPPKSFDFGGKIKEAEGKEIA